jgi:hypothetical protein
MDQAGANSVNTMPSMSVISSSQKKIPWFLSGAVRSILPDGSLLIFLRETLIPRLNFTHQHHHL